MTDKGARIEIGSDGHAVRRQVSIGSFDRPPIAGDGRKLAHGQAFDVRTARLPVVAVRPVVANLGVGQHDDLSAVRWIGEDFLIACDGGVEYHFAFAIFRSAEGGTLEHRAVFECQDGDVQMEWSSEGDPLKPAMKGNNLY